MTVSALQQTAIADPSARLKSTPYARRLARERTIALDALRGSGPGGRILGRDVVAFVPVVSPLPQVAPSVAAIDMPPAPLVAPFPEALAIRVELTGLEALAGDLAIAHPGLSARHILLKAVAIALAESPGWQGDAILLAGGGPRLVLGGLSTASLRTVMARQAGAGDDGAAVLAVSFVERAGIRPVAARLTGEAPARLVVGAIGNDGYADCLLSYDPDRVGGERAVEFLDRFRGLLETPLRILV